MRPGLAVGLGILLLALGACLVALDVARGSAQAGIIVIMPYVVGGGLYSLGGIMLIIAGMFVVFFGHGGGYEWAAQKGPPAPQEGEPRPGENETQKPRKARYGGVVLVGPIPIIFGSDKNSMYIAVALALVLMAVSAFLLYFVLKGSL